MIYWIVGIAIGIGILGLVRLNMRLCVLKETVDKQHYYFRLYLSKVKMYRTYKAFWKLSKKMYGIHQDNYTREQVKKYRSGLLNLRKELFYLYKKCGGFHD